MRHELRMIVDPPIYGARVWQCTCGHRSYSSADHREHVEAMA